MSSGIYEKSEQCSVKKQSEGKHSNFEPIRQPYCCLIGQYFHKRQHDGVLGPISIQ